MANGPHPEVGRSLYSTPGLVLPPTVCSARKNKLIEAFKKDSFLTEDVNARGYTNSKDDDPQQKANTRLSHREKLVYSRSGYGSLGFNTVQD